MPGIAYCSNPLVTEAESVLITQSRDWKSERPLSRFPLVPIRNQARAAAAPVQIQAAAAAAASPSRFHKSIRDRDNSQQSHESENDLAAMVHDFLENGDDEYEGSDKESPGPTGFALVFEKLKTAAMNSSPIEKELRAVIVAAILSLPDDSVCSTGIECKSRCIRSALVKRLRASGYDVGTCKSHWQTAGRVPGGEYEFIDAVTGEGRFIVDLDFRSHFEIARPIPQYKAALRLLPGLFIGSARKVKQIVEIMSEAAKVSLRQSLMHLPPWRTGSYLLSKWLSPTYRRETESLVSGVRGNAASGDCGVAAGCCWQLKRTKACLLLDTRTTHSTAPAQAPPLSRLTHQCSRS